VTSADLKADYPGHLWRATRKTVTSKAQQQRRILPRLRPEPPPLPVRPIRPLNSLAAEMWEDYRIFKAAGLLKEWRRKWAAYLPD
jgi:hypothetical protein